MAKQVVVMGVSGSGKSTVAALLAERTGCALADADDFHPASSIARPAAGRTLDDARRAPWLAARRGHFMSPALLDSQYAELEPLDADEPGITVDLAADPERITDQVLQAFGPLTSA